MAEKTAKLTPRRARFVEEYLIDLNATQAAIRAGYGKKNARSTAAELLQMEVVQEAIAGAKEKRSERTGITADRVLQELARIAFADIRKAVSWSTRGVTIVESEDVDDDTALAIQEVTERTTETERGGTTTIKVKMYDKLRSLDMLARHLGLFSREEEQKKPVKLTPDNVVHIWERARARARASGQK